MRLEFTLDEFFASGGVTSFVDNMAASLGIHAADIKVVSVYEGSTIVDFEILEAVSAVADAVVPSINLEAVAQTFSTVVSTMDTFMGSPVLNAVATGAQIVTPNTVFNEDGEIDDPFTLDFGGFGNREQEKPEPEVQVEVVYRTKRNKTKYDVDRAQSSGFVFVILCAIIMLLLILIAVGAYKMV